MKKSSFVQLGFYLSLSCILGCNSDRQTKQSSSVQSAQTATKASEDSKTTYSWSAAKTGPGNMPRLQAMMEWYSTQAENIKQMDFIEGQPEPDGSDTDGPAPTPRGPYDVTFDIVDAYLTLLRKSGYFSEHYLATLRAQAQTKQLALQKDKTQERNLPHMDEFPLFVANYDDMMSDKDSLHFTAEEAGKVITLNDGFSLQRFTFDTAGKIDSVK